MAGNSNLPVVVGEIVLLPVSKIQLGSRARPVDMVWAAALGRIMATDGQHTPIEVRTLAPDLGWEVVAGAHRLEGAKIEGLDNVRAIVVDGAAINHKLREISENLWRRELSPVDRATFIAEMHDLLRARSGIDSATTSQSIAASARWRQALKSDAEDASIKVTGAYGWTGEIAAQLGLSKNAIEKDLFLARRLGGSELAALRRVSHPILRNASQLRSLARLEPSDREAVIAALTSGIAQTIAQALARIRPGIATDPQAKLLSSFLSSFSRMGISEKRGALSALSAMLPKGVTISGLPE